MALFILLGKICLFFYKYNFNSTNTYVLTGLSYALKQSSKSQIIKYFLLNDIFNVGNIDFYPSDIHTNQYSGILIVKIFKYLYFFVRIQIYIKGLNNLLGFLIAKLMEVVFKDVLPQQYFYQQSLQRSWFFAQRFV